LPEAVTVAGRKYHRVDTFKHDFFAATGLYEGGGRRVVLKVGRQAEIAGLPLDWLGRWLTHREAAIYQHLHDLPGVPEFVGCWGDKGLVHAFVPGHPMERNEWVNDAFFARLQRLIEEMHGRNIAYVDLNKRSNVIVGDDGLPYLIDFQISCWWPPRWGRMPKLFGWVLARFQRGDLYHLAKHMRKHRPDQVRPEHEAMWLAGQRLVRVHGWITRPFTQVRRRTLQRLGHWRRQPD
jgi:hypothetical protein